MMNCKPEVLYVAIAHIEHEIALSFVQGEGWKEVPLSILTSLSIYFTL